MEILVITWNYPPRRGGIENLIGGLCAELQKKHSVQVITTHTRLSMSGEKAVFRAPLPGLVPFALYALWRGTVLLARNRRIAVIFGGSALVAPLALILARLFGRRLVLQTHGLDIIYRSFFYQQLCVRWLKSCDHIVANSRYTAQLAQSKGVLQARLTVIPPGVQLERFNKPTDAAADKRAWGVEDRKIILFVGRLAKRKGLKEFVENSFVKIVRQVPEVCLMIVGNNPTESLAHHYDAVGGIRAAVSTLELENHVHLLGSLSDDQVIKLYQACDLVILPALEMKDDVEGFGIVALEAAAAGKPVVATRVGGIPDAVEDRKSGAVVEPGDYEGLSKEMVRLLKDPSARSAMGDAGRRRATKQFAWAEIVRSYEIALGFSSASKSILQRE
jgi:phosphatidylinositol alpha-1,6-mannosyltransferase